MSVNIRLFNTFSIDIDKDASKIKYAGRYLLEFTLEGKSTAAKFL